MRPNVGSGEPSIIRTERYSLGKTALTSKTNTKLK